MAAQSVRFVTANNAVIKGSEDVIIFNSAGAINFYIGPAHGDGRKFELKNIGAGAVTLLPDTGETIFSTSEESSKVLYTGESAGIIDSEAEKWVYKLSVGANTTPVTRTVGQLVAGNAPNTNIDLLDTAIGADSQLTAVTRTKGPVSTSQSVYENIDDIDAVIGADSELTAVARTTGAVATSQTIYQNIDDLDAAIGADPSPCGARTAGAITAAGTVNANIDALDASIGFEAQMSGTPKNVAKAATVFQNLDALDTYKSVQTIKKIIGGVGVAGCDFNFATAENQNEQVIDLGAIIPAHAKIFHALTITNNTFTGAITLAAETGVTSSGNELIASAGILTAGDFTEPAVGALSPIAITAAAKNVFVSATPGANWNLVTAGKVSVYITFINFANI